MVVLDMVPIGIDSWLRLSFEIDMLLVDFDSDSEIENWVATWPGEMKLYLCYNRQWELVTMD